MHEASQRLQAVLDGYAKFLRDKDLALPQHQPYLVRWVREFLAFAGAHSGYTFEQTLDLYLSEVGKREGVKPWQVQQAADAVRISLFGIAVENGTVLVRFFNQLRGEGLCTLEAVKKGCELRLRPGLHWRAIWW